MATPPMTRYRRMGDDDNPLGRKDNPLILETSGNIQNMGHGLGLRGWGCACMVPGDERVASGAKPRGAGDLRGVLIVAGAFCQPVAFLEPLSAGRGVAVLHAL